MGICAIQHRCITGKYNSNFNIYNVDNKCSKVGRPTTEISRSSNSDIYDQIYLMCMIFYGYVVCLLMSFIIEYSLKLKHSSLSSSASETYTLHFIKIHEIHIYYYIKTSFKFFQAASETYSTVQTSPLRDYLNNCFIILILCIYKKIRQNTTCNKNKNIVKHSWIFSMKNYFCISTLAAQYTYWVAFLNLVLIIICNPVILNPGPIQGNPKLTIFLSKCKGICSSH